MIFNKNLVAAMIVMVPAASADGLRAVSCLFLPSSVVPTCWFEFTHWIVPSLTCRAEI